MGDDDTPDTGRAATSPVQPAEPTERRIAGYADALADAVTAALPSWIRSAVASRHAGPLPAPVEQRIEAEAAEAVADIGSRLRDLLALDVDDQWTNPLAIIRSAVRYPTAVLRDAGVDPVDRDHDAQRLQPDDVYDLTPGAFADLGPEVHEPGLLWGAAKAHLHLSRRHQPASTGVTGGPPGTGDHQ